MNVKIVCKKMRLDCNLELINTHQLVHCEGYRIVVFNFGFISLVLRSDCSLVLGLSFRASSTRARVCPLSPSASGHCSRTEMTPFVPE